MSRLSLRAALLLLSVMMVTTAVVARTTAGFAGTMKPKAGNAQSQAATNGPVHMIEGCLSRVDRAFLLTDEKGRTYLLTGDTAQLLAHTGSEVRLWGNADDESNTESITAADPIPSFNVQRARSLSSGCPTLRG